LNFQYDAVACAVAAGWAGATMEEIRLAPVLDAGRLRFAPAERGRATTVVVDMDADDFTERWFAAIERPARRAAFSRRIAGSRACPSGRWSA
jgi:hypothetical protein